MEEELPSDCEERQSRFLTASSFVVTAWLTSTLASSQPYLKQSEISMPPLSPTYPLYYPLARPGKITFGRKYSLGWKIG